MDDEEKDRDLFIKKSVLIILYIFFVLALLSLLFSIFIKLFSDRLFILIDKYLTIILTSWPAAIIIISCILLYQQKDAIDEFIRKRIISIGPGGVNASPLTSDASEREVTAKAIEDIKETPARDGEVCIEENVQRTEPKSSNQEFLLKLKKIRKIEESVQVILQANLGQEYRPNVKLTKGLRTIILDGLLTSGTGKKTAVEIRYIGANKHPETLKFIISKLREKLIIFGIKRVLLIIVADDLNPYGAQKINDLLAGFARVDFYNLKGGNPEQIIPIIKNEEGLS
ncbi:MAG: hypothetical protein WC711_01240 [Candidatus Staskawiczbacteria bacterium]|jgi:hypothetical protein